MVNEQCLNNNHDCHIPPIENRRLWVIEFSIKNVGNGCAVVKARNPKEAETLLRAEGMYNGMSYMYNIIRIEEVIPSPDSMLIAEQIATERN